MLGLGLLVVGFFSHFALSVTRGLVLWAGLIRGLWGRLLDAGGLGPGVLCISFVLVWFRVCLRLQKVHSHSPSCRFW